MGDVYRPAYQPRHFNDRGPPPPLMHRFGQAASLQTQNQFFFRANDAPRYPADSHAPPPPPPLRQGLHDDRHQRVRQASRRNGNHDASARNRHAPYDRRRKPATSSRPLLQFERGATPEQLRGIHDSSVAERRFLDVDEMSDSDEEDMEESEEDYEPAGGLGEDDDGALHSHKRRKVTMGPEPAKPKWSNPETYTSLPPLEESQRKRKDMVKLIRKARVTVEKEEAKANQVATNDDFISFDMDDGNDEDNEEEDEAEERGQGVPGAPTAPRLAQANRALNAPFERADAEVVQIALRSGVSDVPGAEEVVHVMPTVINGVDVAVKVLETTSIPARPIVAHVSVAGKLQEHRKRKRSLDEAETGTLRPPKRQMGIGSKSVGYILQEWAAVSAGDAIPWIIRDHRLTESGGFRLHKEICDFYDFVKPRPSEQVVRTDLLKRLDAFARRTIEDCQVHGFGSFAAGLYLPNADMDVVLVSRAFMEHGIPTFHQSHKSMNRLGGLLESCGMAAPGSVEVIAKAKVPLVKFVDRLTGLRVDMSFENYTGIVANETFQSWKTQFPGMPIIVVIIKQFLLMRGLNNVATGGLGGFSVTCLVTSLLQNMPRVQTGELVPEDNLGEVLLEFLDLYGNRFDVARTGIRMNPPGYIDKTRLQIRDKANRLTLIDPNREGNNISGGSNNIGLILDKFAQAREEIFKAMGSSSRKSLLDWMLGGNYSTFLWHRHKLRECFKDKFGHPGSEYEDSEGEGQAQAPTYPLRHAGAQEGVASGYPVEIDTADMDRVGSKAKSRNPLKGTESGVERLARFKAAHPEIAARTPDLGSKLSKAREKKLLQEPKDCKPGGAAGAARERVKRSKAEQKTRLDLKKKKRADDLKRERPDIANVPDMISVKQRKTLVQNADKPAPKSKQQSNGSKASSQDPAGSDMHGTTNDDPITID